MEEKMNARKSPGPGGWVPRCAAVQTTGWIVLCLASALWLVLPVAGQAGGIDCMECHSGGSIDAERYEQSVHKTLSCAECHQKGFDKDPHAGKAAEAPSCMECHEGTKEWDEAAQGVKASVHTEMVDENFQCVNCHDPHYFLPARRSPDSTEGFAAFNQSCLKCHAAGETPANQKVALAELGARHKRAIPHEMVHLERVACVACHTSPEETSAHRILPAPEAIRDCGKCHSKESLLVARFDTFLAEKEYADTGWLNAALYDSAYLTGATRNRWLDWGIALLLVMVLAGIGGHALLRWFFGYIRRTS